MHALILEWKSQAVCFFAFGGLALNQLKWTEEASMDTFFIKEYDVPVQKEAAVLDL